MILITRKTLSLIAVVVRSQLKKNFESSLCRVKITMAVVFDIIPRVLSNIDPYPKSRFE